MTNDFPHSQSYLARQAARQEAIGKLRGRQGWSNEMFLAERDAAYVTEQRNSIPYQIADYERQIRDDTDIEGYVAKYRTDEG